MQERARRGELSVNNVRGEDNIADGLTKHVERSKMEMHMEKCGFVLCEGRRKLCPYFRDAWVLRRSSIWSNSFFPCCSHGAVMNSIGVVRLEQLVLEQFLE